ncbi:MAG: error-prone repair protein UmuD [Uliginosibacterium sp.]|nr:error-prone repair protein UmuD [Uliginosibacterium sp.]
MAAQLSLPFVSLVGASPSAPPEAAAGVQRTRRNRSVPRTLPLASRTAEGPPAQNQADESRFLDVHDYLVRRDDTSFVFPMPDDGMSGAGLLAGDMLVVDQRITPAHGHIVLAVINGERLVRRLHHRGRKTSLLAEHPELPEVLLEDGSELTIWGVVVGEFKRLLG